MIEQVCIFVTYNLYESKRYFCQKFAESLKRKGVAAHIFDMQNGNLNQLAELTAPDIFCSFNRMQPLQDGRYPFEILKKPFIAFLVDPACYYSDYIFSKNIFISCVDKMDCSYLQNKGFQNVLFWPHAVEKELSYTLTDPRPYDVVLIGSCYDPEGLRQAWKARYSKEWITLIEEAVERTFYERNTPFWQAVDEAIKRQNHEISKNDRIRILTAVDNYMRGVDRFELITSIKDAEVHVFGGTCWREEHPIAGWAQTLAKFPNITVHPAVPFKEALSIMKQSKICLNSMPFFKEGTHERIFASLALGSLPVTTDNLWVQKILKMEKS